MKIQDFLSHFLSKNHQRHKLQKEFKLFLKLSQRWSLILFLNVLRSYGFANLLKHWIFVVSDYSWIVWGWFLFDVLKFLRSKKECGEKIQGLNSVLHSKFYFLDYHKKLKLILKLYRIINIKPEKLIYQKIFWIGT